MLIFLITSIILIVINNQNNSNLYNNPSLNLVITLYLVWICSF